MAALRMLGFTGKTGPASPLEADLKRATHLEAMDISKDALAAILKASRAEGCRRLIMYHLRGCMCDSSPAHWRRIYAAVLILEELLRKGPVELVSETAAGMHFDLVQRLSFLENFHFTEDKRVERALRRKAALLRTAWLDKQLALEDDRSPESSGSEQVEGKCDRADQLHDASTTDGESVRSRDRSPGHGSSSSTPTSARLHPAPANSVDLLAMQPEEEAASASAQFPAAPAPALPPLPTELSRTAAPAEASQGVDLLAGLDAPATSLALASSASSALDGALGDAWGMGSAPAVPLAMAAATLEEMDPFGAVARPLAFAVPTLAPRVPRAAPAAAPDAGPWAPLDPFAALIQSEVAAEPIAPTTTAAPAAEPAAVDWLKVAACHGLYGDALAGGDAGAAGGAGRRASTDTQASLLDF